jgi:hypothetical protein
VLAFTLVPGACAASSGGVVEPSEGDGGRKQPVLHVAACALQVIKQFVVVELCAEAALAQPCAAATANTTAHNLMTAGLRSEPTL